MGTNLSVKVGKTIWCRLEGKAFEVFTSDRLAEEETQDKQCSIQQQEEMKSSEQEAALFPIQEVNNWW